MPGAGGSVSGTAAWSTASNQLAITLTVPGGLVIAASPVIADTVSITLPSGLFSGTPALLSGSAYTGTPTLSGEFALTKITSPIAANASTTITITGITLVSNAYQSPKRLSVRTSKDINTVGINISGIPSV
jgi:hypothetical protein